VATASMGGLDSAAATAVTTTARLVADAYMAVPADVAAAPAAAVGPVSCMDLISRDMNLYGLIRTTCGCRNDTRVYLHLWIFG
jgi:hypothetical protein